ncbi:hypothetical protein GPALN_012168 [Globodera pallida]|nr:hypothetical protein GPALN_012168 [Globodera pallida]
MVQHYPKLEKHFLSFIREGDAEGMRSLWDNHLGESQRSIFRSTTFEGVSPLFLAASLGHLEISKVLVARGADVNQESGDDSSPWLIACEKGHLDIVELFVEDGQDIEFTHSDGDFSLRQKNGHFEVCKVLVAKGADANRESENSSPWLIACEKNHLDIVKLFVENGQDIEVTNMYGATGLIVVCIEGNANLVRFLLSEGARVDWTTDKGVPPLFFAAGQGHLEMCADLVAKGAAVNEESNNGFSPWLEACGKGHLHIVEFFVENGQNIEFTHSNGYTALIIASAFGKTNVGHFLLSKGARVGRTNAFGLPALFFAAKEGHLEMCKELVARGADANQKSDNSSPWLEACAKGHLNIARLAYDFYMIADHFAIEARSPNVEFFANNGQYIEATDSDGDTGLIAASFNGKADVVRFLLLKNARFGRTIDEASLCEKEKDRTFYCLFVEHFSLKMGFRHFSSRQGKGHLDVCKVLVAKGADVNRESENGFSPWLEACEKGHLDIVKFFVAEGQDTEFTYSDGITGLMFASREERTNVVRFLLSIGARIGRTDAKN